MYILLLIVHVIVCLFLIIVVLLQSGKAADLAGAFGGMGSQTAFGPRGSATLLSKATTISAVLFRSDHRGPLAERESGGPGRGLRRYGLANGVRPAWFGHVVVEGDYDFGGSVHGHFAFALHPGDAERRPGNYGSGGRFH